MALINDVAGDLGGVRQAVPQVWTPDPREGWGGSWQPGEPIEVVRQKMGAEQKYQAGIEQTKQSFRLFTRLPGGVPPVKEEDRLRLDGMMLSVVSVVPVESPGSEGCIVTAVAEERDQ